MNQAIAKAAGLVEAYEYIRRFDGKIVVVKVGGSIMDDPSTLKNLIQDVCFMHAVGMRPVVVHGGGKRITEAMQAEGIEAQFVHGRRYTDERTLAIVEHVLVNEVNKELAELIFGFGAKAMGLNSLGSCAVFAQRLYLESASSESGSDGKVERGDGSKTRRIDLGLVGEVEWVNANLIGALVEADYIPVIAPVARDKTGGKLNVNADSVAGRVAAAMRAEKLVLVSDTHGIRTSHDPDSLASHVTKGQAQGLIDEGVIIGGMLPKVEASLTALEAGVTKAHIIDGRVQHSLMLEVYTQEGIGTEIVL